MFFSLIGVKSAEEQGKLIQDGAQELVSEKTEQPLDRLMEAEQPEFLGDASNAVPGELRNGHYSRNSIESFNSLLKRQMGKRILMNGESNALITIVSVCSSYNSSTPGQDTCDAGNG